MRFLICAAILAAAPAFAEDSMIARNGDNWLRLYDKPCTNEAIRAQIKDEWVDKFRAGHAVVGKQDFEACWIAYAGQVFVVFSDGDQAQIPQNAFKPDMV